MLQYHHADINVVQEVKASCLRALTSMIHLERDPRLGAIIEATGASTYHGFLPSLVRECITSLTGTLNVYDIIYCLFGLVKLSVPLCRC